MKAVQVLMIFILTFCAEHVRADQIFLDEKNLLTFLHDNFKTMDAPLTIATKQIENLQHLEKVAVSQTEAARLISLEAGYNGMIAKILSSTDSMEPLKKSNILYEKSLELAPSDPFVVMAYAKFSRGICDTGFAERVFMAAYHVKYDIAKMSSRALERIAGVPDFNSDQTQDLREITPQLQRCSKK